jgi:NDP-hexose 4-ketoreductase
MQQVEFPLIVTGAGGRVGRLLRKVMPEGRVIWVTRSPLQKTEMAWDQFLHRAPSGAVIVHLAGAVRGDLALNTTLAEQVCGVKGVRHVFVASTAAVYGPCGGLLREDTPVDPQNPYGKAKLAMEQAVRKDGVTILRIGNVAGADALLGGLVPDKTTVLDPVPGQPGGPVRSYIGPVTLGRVLLRLAEMADAGNELHDTLNVAGPGAVAMAELLNAAGADWVYGPPRANVVPMVEMDVKRLCQIVPMAVTTAAGLVAEWRAAQ